MKYDPSFVDLPFFKENGFYKKKCKACGKIFWTLDPDRELCGDQPCVDYTFIGRPTGVRMESPREVREAFLSFFERHGHERVDRYPVVARWRSDVYLVGASIYDFQPWVTEGIVDPPANPLTISQPSIRLTDVDNVGRTGRHLTGFEMMAHHAFNVRGAKVYWANETVEYSFKLFTEVYGIPPEEITFKFDWWSGGGNAGEDYEVLVRGLEVATLVFMHYKVVDDQVIPMENRIVDTGYGLERILWLLNGSTTVYDAVFPRIVDYLRREAGLEPLPRDLAVALAVKAGKLDFKEPERAFKVRSKIARSLGMSVEELERIISPYESIYAVADHSRSIMWMIGDGIVPSNVGAGYLARLLIRRALRHLARAKVEVSLAEVVDRQIDAWRVDFPEYVEIRDEILDIVSYEEERYKEALRRGKRIARSTLSKLAKKGVKKVPVEELVKLYDSHGITPDIVREEARELGLEVEVGPGFYSLLASRHEAARPKAPEEVTRLFEKVKHLPATRKLYYENPKLFEFTAKVIEVLNGGLVILDQTAFYPEGGGQPADVGTLEFNGGSCKVVNVIKVGDVILHKCEGSLPEKGFEVKGRIDAERRLALMRHHTATHIILGAARRVLGRHVWQAGAQKGVSQSRLDITHHKRITEEEVREIEKLANAVVMEDRPVKCYFMYRTDAERKYGFVLYQGGVVPEPELRIVEIEGWDVEACGGTHCSTTGEVGLIKIVKVERIQEGVSRIVFKAGLPALEYVQERDGIVRRLEDALRVEGAKVEDRVRQLLEEVKALRSKLREYEERELAQLASRLAREAEEVAGVKVVAYVADLPPDRVRDLAIAIAREEPRALVVVASPSGNYALKLGDELVRRGVDAREVNKALLSAVKGRGGGVEDLVQGKIAAKDVKKLASVARKLARQVAGCTS